MKESSKKTQKVNVSAKLVAPVTRAAQKSVTKKPVTAKIPSKKLAEATSMTKTSAKKSSKQSKKETVTIRAKSSARSAAIKPYGTVTLPIASPYATELSQKPIKKKLSVIARYIMTPRSFISFLQFDGEEVAIQVARYGGVVTVIIGGLFTMHFATQEQVVSISTVQQQALVATVQKPTNLETVVAPSNNRLVPLSSDSVHFRLPTNTPVRGTVQIALQVPAGTNVQSVAVVARNKTTKQEFKLGFATRKTNELYELDFSTPSVPNGEYMFEAALRTATDITTIRSEKSIAIDNYFVALVSEPKLPETVSPFDSSLSSNQVPREGLQSAVPIVEAQETQPIIIDQDKQQEVQQPEVNPPILAFTEVTIETLPTNPSLQRLFLKQAATWVEFYALPESSNSPLYIGRAYTLGGDIWQFVWDTTLVPPRGYEVYARAKTPSGIITSAKKFYVVQAPQKPAFDTVVNNSSVNTESTPREDFVQATASVMVRPLLSPDFHRIDDLLSPAIKASSTLIASFEVPNKAQEEVVSLPSESLDAYQARIQPDLERMSVALRNGDSDEVNRIATTLALSVAQSMEENNETDETTKATLQRLVAARVVHVERSNKILSQRTPTQAEVDTDGDGVADYDEIHLYGTDPQNKDTDSDGFLDSEEIKGGYSPTDASPQAVIATESPKLYGITRSDLLSVTSIDPLVVSLGGTEIPAAYFSGTAMPNSFVTLFVFSTPIVITLQADSRGNWSYLFDRELENGEHDVYVGMTDNAGRLVAKSEPIRFAKTAQAYSPVGDVQGGQQGNVSETTMELYSTQSLLLVASISVVAIGLLLILLGHFMHFRRKENFLSEASPAV